MSLAAKAVGADNGMPQASCSPIACNKCGVYQLCVPLGLDGTDLGLLESIVKRKEVYKRGQVLFRAGDRFDHIYALRSGSVKTSVSSEDGRVQITGFHIAGELLGLSAYASGQYSCEARALETVSVCKVGIDRLDEIAQTLPTIHYQMLKIAGVQIRRDEELMLLLGTCKAEERLADYLIGLSRRFASRNYSPTQFRLSMSRKDIGNYLGMAEETVCRILTRFHEDGCVSIANREVRLNDIGRLAAIVRSGA